MRVKVEFELDEAVLAPRPVEMEVARIFSVAAARLLRACAPGETCWSVRDIFGTHVGSITFEDAGQ